MWNYKQQSMSCWTFCIQTHNTRFARVLALRTSKREIKASSNMDTNVDIDSLAPQLQQAAEYSCLPDEWVGFCVLAYTMWYCVEHVFVLHLLLLHAYTRAMMSSYFETLTCDIVAGLARLERRAMAKLMFWRMDNISFATWWCWWWWRACRLLFQVKIE